eukprot:TRINITY_DN75012_c0_g1_i1.p1 TRINITY_DN75012_c0_g1~~TRINITY_DN75012_c0_g1_i1.p1  ORF type:complete len:455 (+),score=78.85 TRINITY_DN75012_c0_g1_i1:77-1366(+)
MRSVGLVSQLGARSRTAVKAVRCNWKSSLAIAGAVCAAWLSLLVATLPRPVDANGVPVMTLMALLEVYASFFVHMMGFIPLTAAPRIDEAILAAAPAEWTIDPLPELIAGKDFKTRAEFVEAMAPFARTRPVVIRGFASHPNAAEWAGTYPELMEQWWTVSKLKEKVGEEEVRVFMNYTSDDTIAWMKFKEFADIITADPDSPVYGRAINEFWEKRLDMHELASQNVQLLHDASGRAAFERAVLDAMISVTGHTIFFVSGRKPSTKFHADLAESWVMHTEGTKRWRFFNPENTMLFRPLGMKSNVGLKMGFDGWNPDFKSNPEARLARGWEAHISAGDLLYFPSQCWHGVENVAPLNVMADATFLNLFLSWRNNWPSTLAMLLHPKPPVEFAKYCFFNTPSNDGHALPQKYACSKEVYFQSFKTLKNAR